MSDKDEIMTVKQVAELIGWHPNTVYLRCMNGEIESFKLGRSRRIYKSNFLKWLKTQD